jgi:DNA-binding CsgD family transcriptional regulator
MLSVVVAHREAIAAEGIAGALARHPQIIPTAAVSTAEEGEDRARGANAIALDRRLPGAREVAGRLCRAGVRVVFLGGEAHDAEDDLENEGVHVPVDGHLSSLVAALLPQSSSLPRKRSRLTGRERQILGLVAQGLSARQVGRHLGISIKTVENHKTRIFAKLGVPNQTAAVSMALAEDMPGVRTWSPSSI